MRRVGLRWAEFEAAAPDLAASAQQVVQQHGFLFLGTIRQDGTPRISPVEAHFVAGELMLVLIPRTAKARDLSRDRRMTLQSPVVGASAPGREVKMQAYAVEVAAGQRAPTAEAVESVSGWRPGADWRYCAVVVHHVAVLDWLGGDMHLAQWDIRTGVAPGRRRRLDMERGEYRPVE